ncbi:MAG TPA: ZPR1 zinc finger domain-containing protein, partial [Methanomicrobiales archaeon]|nr:ZPR1 zinc finger domain-containing protein [Methanomicrobiales archaeon]
VPGRCPYCEREIQYLYKTENIPYFSDILIVSARCECGYRHADTMVLAGSEPARWEMRVETPEDLVVRVVRSASARMEIPELGVEIDPGPACEGFVSNIEGVLDRVDNVVAGVLTWAEGEERENALALRERIGWAREGRFPFTLSIQDLTGNSAIVSEKAEKSAIPACQDQEGNSP